MLWFKLILDSKSGPWWQAIAWTYASQGTKFVDAYIVSSPQIVNEWDL